MKILFPKQLKKYREKKNLSQEDLAGRLYVSRQAISRWEAGDATPDLGNLIKLAEIFDCSLDALVIGTRPQADERIDHNEFIFDPRKGKYIRRHHTFWDFFTRYWWMIFALIGIAFAFGG